MKIPLRLSLQSIEKEMMNSKPIVECNENYMTNIVAGLVNLFKNAIHMGFPELIGSLYILYVHI